jgi:hypothetical protein
MSYRDNYTAALARAEAAERRLAELRAEKSEDQARLEGIERELAAAKEALARAKISPLSQPGQVPSSSGGVVALVLVGGLLFLGAIGLAGSSSSSSESYTVPYTLPPLPTLVDIPKISLDTCDPEGLGLKEAKPIPFFEIAELAGCDPLPNEEAALGMIWAVESEEELVRRFHCSAEAKKRGSGLDFRRFRLLVVQRTMLYGDRLRTSALLDDGKALTLVAKIEKPCQAMPLETRAGVLGVLVPRQEERRELALETCYGIIGSCVAE